MLQKSWVSALCAISIISVFSKNIQAQCNANFEFITNGSTVSFYKTNVNANETLLWNLGNGFNATSDSFTFIYATEGIYNVCLQVQIDSLSPVCLDSLCKEVVVCNDCVWPGDANADKSANNKDVLYVGLAYGLVGPARSTSLTTGWQPQFNTSSWVSNFSPQNTAQFNDGTNFKHADCDGNGIIDDNDITVIDFNYNLNYNKNTVTTSTCNNINDLPLFVEFLEDSIEMGSVAKANIRLGSSFIQAADIYGIAYTLHYDAALIDSNSININYDNSGLKKSPTDKIIYLNKPFRTDGKIESGISRTDCTGKIFPSGPIGIVDFVMEDNLAQKNTLYDWLHFHFTNVFLITNNETIIPVCAFSDSVLVYEKVSGIDDKNKNNIQLFPNPANDKLFIKHHYTKVEEVMVYNALGQIQNCNVQQYPNRIEVNTTYLQRGVYCIQLKNSQETKYLKFEKY